MSARLLVAIFLLTHGLIHTAFLAPPPAVTAGGPTWPFDLHASWALRRLGMSPERTQSLGTAVVAAAVAGLALAAVTLAAGLAAALVSAAVLVGVSASAAVLVLFFRPWLALGIVIDVVLALAAVDGGWLVAA